MTEDLYRGYIFKAPTNQSKKQNKKMTQLKLWQKKRHFPKEEIQKAGKHIKRHWVSLLTKELQIKLQKNITAESLAD